MSGTNNAGAFVAFMLIGIGLVTIIVLASSDNSTSPNSELAASEASCVQTLGFAINDADCQAWKDLYDSTNGANWTTCSDKRTDPCGCHPLAGPAAVSCITTATFTRIFTIDLSNNNLRGTLPPTLADLNLHTIDVSKNHLTGLVPNVTVPEDGCRLYDHPQSNAFACPFPDTILSHCQKVDGTGNFAQLTTSDCQ